MKDARSLFAILCGSLLVLAAAPGHASPISLFGTFCGPYIPGGGSASPPQTCAETAVGGDGPGDELGFNGAVVSPDTFIPGLPSSTAGGGGGGMFGSAAAIADFGHLRTTVAVTNPNPGTVNSNIVGRALASFSDKGNVSSVSLVTGSFAHAKATIDVSGAFSRFGEATVELVISNAEIGLLTVFDILLADFRPSVHQEFEFSTPVGADITVAMFLRTQANAPTTEDGFTLASSGADLGNSAHFFLDFDDASFDAASGHNYRSDALAVTPVPGPASLWILLLGLAGIRLGRRRNAN